MDLALHRLATYGTLAPGRPNDYLLNGLEGRWLEGDVDGMLVDAGWGADLGYPALILDPDGSAIDVEVFESVDLPAHWARLDAFEGPGYQRVVTIVTPQQATSTHRSISWRRPRTEDWSGRPSQIAQQSCARLRCGSQLDAGHEE